jgi:hypothetical protein
MTPDPTKPNPNYRRVECHHPKSKVSTLGEGWKWCSQCGAVRWTREHWRRPSQAPFIPMAGFLITGYSKDVTPIKIPPLNWNPDPK